MAKKKKHNIIFSTGSSPEGTPSEESLPLRNNIPGLMVPGCCEYEFFFPAETPLLKLE